MLPKPTPKKLAWASSIDLLNIFNLQEIELESSNSSFSINLSIVVCLKNCCIKGFNIVNIKKIEINKPKNLFKEFFSRILNKKKVGQDEKIKVNNR